MAHFSWNWYSGLVLTLNSAEVDKLIVAFNAGEKAVDAALALAKITGPYAWLVKPVIKGLFQFRLWNINAANRNRRGVYITFTWLLFGSLFIPSPLTGPLPATILNAIWNPLFVFIGPR